MRENSLKPKKDFMEQLQHGFSDSTPRAGSNRLQKSAKSLLSELNLMSIIRQISTQRPKVWVWSFRPFLNRRKNRPIGGRLRNHSDF